MSGVSNPRVVLAAGGTGGHVFPAEALAAELLERGVQLTLFTDRRGGAYGGVLGEVEMRFVRSGRMAGRTIVARLQGGAELALGFVQARSLLKRTAPRAVVGFGGYASVPTVLAATVMGYPTLIHEQNAVLGRANRLLAARVSKIATVFDDVGGLPAGRAGKTLRTGMPVRPAFAAARRQPYPPIEGDGPLRLFVIGGSQGARVFSDVVPAAVERLAGVPARSPGDQPAVPARGPGPRPRRLRADRRDGGAANVLRRCRRASRAGPSGDRPLRCIHGGRADDRWPSRPSGALSARHRRSPDGQRPRARRRRRRLARPATGRSRPRVWPNGWSRCSPTRRPCRRPRKTPAPPVRRTPRNDWPTPCWR